jgi:hypothetical protein
MINRVRQLTAVSALAALCAAAAHAGTETVELVRSTLQNVPDAAGIYQYEGGTLESSSGAELGTFLIVRRTGSSTAAYNTAATTITLFFPPTQSNGAPGNVTIEGAWSFSSGAFVGAVSASSSRFHWIVGADVSSTIPSGTTSQLVLNWVGSNTLQL